MYLSYLLDATVLLSLANGVSSSPVAQGASPNCVTGDIAVVKRTVNEPAHFCAWWNSETRTTSPFLELTALKVNNACECIVTLSKPTSKNKRAASPSSAQSCMSELSVQFTQPYHFCTFYNAVSRTTSPFRKYSAQSLIALCNCVEGKPSSSSVKKTSIKTPSSSKTIIKTSSTKAITTSAKPSSTKEITSSSSMIIMSSSKKITSLSKKSSSTLPSSRKSTTSSSSKDFGSTSRPTSSSKSPTSSLQKTVSSTKLVSSTKKISGSSSSSSKKITGSPVVKSPSVFTRTTSTTSRNSSSTSTAVLVKPTSSNKSSSKGLISSTIIQSSSTTITSASATKTPTSRTDGQFYMRVGNTTAPPNGYYATGGDGYALGPARNMLFVIESNGYLRQLPRNGNSGYWMTVQFDSTGMSTLAAYSEFGQYSAQNLRCTYDENYLLSCATVLVNGALSPVTFAYRQHGPFYEWMAVSKPDVLPEVDLYVEVVAPYPTTASSSSSATSASSSLSLSSSSAPSSTSSSTSS